MVLAQTAFMYAPAMNWLFHAAPLGRDEWLLTLDGGLLIYWAVGVEKFMRRLVSRSPK